ncbi:hypothetical protein RT723_02300 [Psychrosphaera aquimarina]|uniref:Uncharacterized protein n=1 Tax=Psychrosphaera aquimarina TaxID=2044854 RepID=A0ABU3QWP7_9GAMM|nr:hypothetical protein [Psychrosphaera aquimarina]MDU0111856.1 hypothetical protein [Psychrosphaera aquimarina]
MPSNNGVNSNMEKEYIAAAATIIAALVTLFGAIYVHRKTAENAKASEHANKEISRIARESSEQHERSLSMLNSRLEQAVHKANSTYSKKLEVLSSAYNLLGSIKFLVESYLTPYTEHSKSGDPEKMKDACLQFEELRKYHMSNAIFFDSDDQLGSSMGEIMGELNRINNLDKSSEGADDFWRQQVKAFQTVIEPSISSVKSQFRKSLQLGE